MHKTVATRIPIELEDEIIRFMKEEGLDKSSAIRRILEIGVGEWKRKRAIELYKSGKVTLWKASLTPRFKSGACARSVFGQQKQAR
jgi:hypothetical protein